MTTSKSSKAPLKPYTLFDQLWVECEKKTNSPTKSKSGKSKKCKASKSADAAKYTASDAVEQTVEKVEPVLFDVPEKTVVRQHIDHVLICFSVAQLNYVSHIEYPLLLYHRITV